MVLNYVQCAGFIFMDRMYASQDVCWHQPAMHCTPPLCALWPDPVLGHPRATLCGAIKALQRANLVIYYSFYLISTARAAGKRRSRFRDVRPQDPPQISHLVLRQGALRRPLMLIKMCITSTYPFRNLPHPGRTCGCMDDCTFRKGKVA